MPPLLLCVAVDGRFGRAAPSSLPISPLSPLPPLLPLFPFWSSPPSSHSHPMFRQQQQPNSAGSCKTLSPKLSVGQRERGGGGGGRAKCEAGFLANFENFYLSWLKSRGTKWLELPKAPWSLTSGECVCTQTVSERGRKRGSGAIFAHFLHRFASDLG